jgi:hypothetical protein
MYSAAHNAQHSKERDCVRVTDYSYKSLPPFVWGGVVMSAFYGRATLNKNGKLPVTQCGFLALQTYVHAAVEIFSKTKTNFFNNFSFKFFFFFN